MSRTSLAGKVVLVTGAARGIGEHTARLAAARGARVALVGLEPERLAAVAADLGNGHVWAECDVRDQTALDCAVELTTSGLGGIDVVVANAGVANLGTVAITPSDALVTTIEVNLLGVVRTVSATLPAVTERRGHYLLVSSMAAFAVLPGMAAYAASKAGVEQFGNGLRLEVAHKGVTVGTAHMGFVDTDMARDVAADLPSLGPMLPKLPGPLGSHTSVEECARAFVQGIERRRRRVYVPRSVGLVQALRAVLLSPLGDAVLRRHARRQVPIIEAEVRALGRSFGRTSAALGRDTTPAD